MTTSWNHEEHQKLTSSKSFVLLNDELSWDRMVLFFHLFSESSPLPESLGRNLWITNSAFGSPDFQTFWLCWKRGITSSRTLVADNLFQDLLSPISWDNSLWILSFLYMSISVYDQKQTNNTYLPMHNPFYRFYFWVSLQMIFRALKLMFTSVKH